MSLTIFANFRIDSEERLQRMRDSFESFRFASIDRWVINARGVFRDDAMKFLAERLGEKLIQYRLESGKGWFQDSKQMLGSIQSEFVLFWIEDQICTCGPDKLDSIIQDIKISNIEYLGYSWYGLGAFLKEFNNLPQKEYATLIKIIYDKKINSLRQRNSIRILGEKSYIISACGIFSIELFKQILQCKRPLLRRWPKETPFDFEKRWDDDYILPIQYGVPKFELFSSIDDDNKHPGSSLFSRGLYPERVSRPSMLALRNSINTSKRFIWFREKLRNIRVAQYIWKIFVRLSYHL